VSKGKIRFENGNEGPLYISLATKTLPTIDGQNLNKVQNLVKVGDSTVAAPAENHNLRLDVSYTDLKGAPIDVKNLQQGTDFRAVVKVSNVSGGFAYKDVALTHIIPSGWEIYNEGFIAASTNTLSSSNSADNRKVSNSYNYRDIRDDRVLTYFDIPAGTQKEFVVRLQASYQGEFILPALQCEAMYAPEARARSVGGCVTVLR
jgi:uncharacterized protein YfaS (alpha-2-macroglobulin family)